PMRTYPSTKLVWMGTNCSGMARASRLAGGVSGSAGEGRCREERSLAHGHAVVTLGFRRIWTLAVQDDEQRSGKHAGERTPVLAVIVTPLLKILPRTNLRDFWS